MTLTVGYGPLARGFPGETNFTVEAPAHRLLLEDYPYRLRAVVGGRVVLDSVRVKILHETGHQIVPYVPLEDIDESALKPSDTHSHCPFKGDASYWSVRGGESLREDAVWAYPQPQAEANWLAGLASLSWERADAWFIEEQVAFGPHLRDPYHRVDVVAAARNVRVRPRGRVVAETTRPKLLFETSLPLRVYVPRIDIAPDVLIESPTRTRCPYKGEATYWSLDINGDRIDDAAWSYETPLAEAMEAIGDVCFLHDEVDVELSEPDPRG